MERLTRLRADTEKGDFIPYIVDNYTGIFTNSTLGKVVERLAYYEDLAAAGRLIILKEKEKEIYPCDDCDIGWATISSKGITTCHETCDKLKNFKEVLKNEEL